MYKILFLALSFSAFSQNLPSRVDSLNLSLNKCKTSLCKDGALTSHALYNSTLTILLELFSEDTDIKSFSEEKLGILTHRALSVNVYNDNVSACESSASETSSENLEQCLYKSLLKALDDQLSEKNMTLPGNFDR